MKKMLILLIMVLPLTAKADILYSCIEQEVGVVTLSNGAEFPSAITDGNQLYSNLVRDGGDNFTVTLRNGYRLDSGKMKKQPNGSYISIKPHGLTYLKTGDIYLVGETDHPPRYREWTVYKHCVSQ